jgi:protein-disulfide isomerase
LRFVFRNFPITQIHPHAQYDAAEAAESATIQNKFWEMHDYLYEHQQAVITNQSPSLILSSRKDRIKTMNITAELTKNIAPPRK